MADALNEDEVSSRLRRLPWEREGDEIVREWRFEDFVGQWTVVQDARGVGRDPQAVANGYVQECVSRSGEPFKLVSAPVQYDERPAQTAWAPEYNEHGDEILAEIGIDWDTVVDLKVRNIVG